jgi:arylsulfatase
MKNKESLRPTLPGSPIHRAGYVRRQEPQSKFPPIEPMRPPKDSPNVLLLPILLDDVGFAAPSTFCDVLPTPALDCIAAGLRDTNFHSTSLC